MPSRHTEPHRTAIYATALTAFFAIAGIALPNLLRLLRSERPNIHEPAYEALKILSGLDYADRDYAAWDAWAAARPVSAADVPALR